jgi:hypothetical protein
MDRTIVFRISKKSEFVLALRSAIWSIFLLNVHILNGKADV